MSYDGQRPYQEYDSEIKRCGHSDRTPWHRGANLFDIDRPIRVSPNIENQEFERAVANRKRLRYGGCTSSANLINVTPSVTSNGFDSKGLHPVVGHGQRMRARLY